MKTLITRRQLTAGLLTATLATSAMAGGFFGFGDSKHRDRGHKGQFKMMFKVADITDEQKDKMRDILRAHKRQSRDERKNQTNRYAGFSSSGFDAETFISAKIAQSTQMAKRQAKMTQELLEVLTDEQKKEFFGNKKFSK